MVVTNEFESDGPVDSSYTHAKGYLMNNIVYIVGAIVIIIAVLSFFGLR